MLKITWIYIQNTYKPDAYNIHWRVNNREKCSRQLSENKMIIIAVLIIVDSFFLFFLSHSFILSFIQYSYSYSYLFVWIFIYLHVSYSWMCECMLPIILFPLWSSFHSACVQFSCEKSRFRSIFNVLFLTQGFL